MKFWHRQSRTVAAALLLLTAACTTVEVNPLSSAPPPRAYKNVVLGTVDGNDPRAAGVVPFFREGFVRRLRELNGFENVTDGASGSAPAATVDTLIVNVTLTEVDKGDAALRFFVGMGAGRERVAATITANNSAGVAVGTLQVRKAYSGGAGIGGVSMLDIEDLTTQAGEQAAQSLLDWAQGKLTKASN